MMLASTVLWPSLIALAAAQSAVPLKNTSADGLLPNFGTPQDNSVLLSFPLVQVGLPIFPRTSEAETILPMGPNADNGIHGELVVNDASSFQKLQPNHIALTNCNPKSYPGHLKLTNVLQGAIRANVAAIVLYADNADYCRLSDDSGYGNYTAIYTAFSQDTGRQLVRVTGMDSTDWRLSIIFSGNRAFDRYLGEHHSYPGFGGGAGSTAVAMVILYSITGVITALFLIIIVTGAIRAHRHPERYGPRNVLGRARESRAKGIARAMLDTIPIVKFGESTPSKDVESPASVPLEENRNRAPLDGTAERSQAQASAGASESSQQPIASASAITDAPPASGPGQAEPVSPLADGAEILGCSICTDDFERGQDIRVLPCNHKFHPACVDPWLLEVSGTCPLCRVDLQPAGSNGEEQGGDALPPPLDPSAEGPAAAMRRRDTLRGFISARWNRRGLQGASGEERLEILRRWRDTRRNQPAPTTPATTDASTVAGQNETASPDDDARQGANRLNLFSRVIRRRER